MAENGMEARDRAVMTALGRLAEGGWSAVELIAVARDAKAPLSVVRSVVRSPTALMLALVDMVDEAVLAGTDLPSDDESPRDRLFDAIMRRFDALSPAKPAIRRLLRELPRRPQAYLPVGPALVQSMRLMLAAAGLPVRGPFGLARAVALAGAYARLYRTWLDDDSEDLAATMSALDKQLAQLEEIANTVDPARRRSKPVAPAAGDTGHEEAET